MKKSKKNNAGYTLVELLIVVVLITIISSLVTPRFDLVLRKSFQTRSKSNLGELRSLIGIYYANTEGQWPLSSATTGTGHTAAGESLYGILVPAFTSTFITPEVRDGMFTNNGIAQNYDEQAKYHMRQNPKEDVFIDTGGPGIIFGVTRPYVYNNQNGQIFIANANFDTANLSMYNW